MIVHINKKWHVFLTIFLTIWLFGIAITPILSQSEIIYLKVITKFLYFFYQPVCHQISDRSFHIDQSPFPVCVRCLSFYLAGWLISLYFLIKKRIKLWSFLIYGVLVGATILDFLFETAGLYKDLILIRFITGGSLGLAIFHLIIFSISNQDLKVNSKNFTYKDRGCKNLKQI